MPKPPGTTVTTAVQQIRPPPLSQHLREFASRRDAWVVLARNMIPVVGIYAFGWSAAMSVFNYWFDGLTALAAIVAAMVPRALRETQSRKDHETLVGNIVRAIFVWLLLVGIVGLPYWIVLIPLHDLLLGNELRRQLAHSPALWFIFGSLAASHFWKAFRVGYDTMPDKELKQRARWDLYLLILRAIARRSESRVPAPHYNQCHDWFSTASTGAASDSNPLQVGRPFRPIGARDNFMLGKPIRLL
jgi:Family of unknown function (DUF6498)